MIAAWDYGGVLSYTQWYLATALVITVLIGIPLWLRAPNVKSKIRSAKTPPQQQPSLGIPLIVLAVIAIGTLQTISWPAAVTHWMSPGTYSAYVDWIPTSIDEERQAAISDRRIENAGWLSRLDPMPASHPLTTGRSTHDAHPLSVTPWLTRRALFGPAIFGLLVMLGIITFRNADRLKLFLALTGVFGAVLSFLGLADIINMETTEQWIDVASPSASSFASFVNRNNAGGYLNLTLASILGYFVWRHSAKTEKVRRQRGYRREYDTAHYSRLAKMIRKAVAVVENSPIVLLSALITIGAIISCGSRGAVLGTLAGLLAIGLVRIGRKSAPTRVIARIGIVMFVLLVIGIVSMTDLAGTRLATLWQTDLAENGRFEHWYDAIVTAANYLPMGSGLGTYRYAYLPYQEFSASGWAINADSLPLEWLVEGGLWLLPLAIIGLVMIVRMLAEIGHNSSHWPQGQAIVVCGMFMICSQVVSQAFDFGFLLPSNLMTFALLTGAIVATHTSLKQSLATNVQGSNTTEPTALAAGPEQTANPPSGAAEGPPRRIAAGESEHVKPLPEPAPTKPSRRSPLAARFLLFIFAAAVTIAMQDAKLDAISDYQVRAIQQASFDDLVGNSNVDVATQSRDPESNLAPLAPLRGEGQGVRGSQNEDTVRGSENENMVRGSQNEDTVRGSQALDAVRGRGGESAESEPVVSKSGRF